MEEPPVMARLPVPRPPRRAAGDGGASYDAYEPEPLPRRLPECALDPVAEPRRFEAPAELPKEKLGFLARMRRVVEPSRNWWSPC